MTKQMSNTSTDNLDETSSMIHDKIDYIVAQVNFGAMLFGIIGNLVCIGVLCQKKLLNRKFNLYLLLLAFADLTFCIIVFINYSIVNSNPNRALYDLSKITCYLTDYIVSSVDALSVFLTLILSIDRLYAITKPIKLKTFFTNVYPKRVALFGYLLLLTIKAPDLFLNQRVYVIPEVAKTSISSATPLTLTMYSIPIDISSANYLNAEELKLIAKNADSEFYKIMKKQGANMTSINYKSIFKNMTESLLKEKAKSEVNAEEPTSLNKESTNLFDEELTRLPYCYSPQIFESPSQQSAKTQSNDSSSQSSPNRQAVVNSNVRFIYVVYSNITVPLILNIIPAFIILVLNFFLWFFIRRYTSQMISINKGVMAETNRTSLVNMTNRTMTRTQKSHYFTIIIMGIWLLITSIPYYSLCTYHWATSLQLITLTDDHRERTQMTIQALSSAFFNSNHCMNIVIYIIFHKDFRANTLKFFISIFNLNPIVKFNPLFFESSRKENFENKSMSTELNNRINNAMAKSRQSRSDGNMIRSFKSTYSVVSQQNCNKQPVFRKASDITMYEIDHGKMGKMTSFSDFNINSARPSIKQKLLIPNESLLRYFNWNKNSNVYFNKNTTNKRNPSKIISYKNGVLKKNDYFDFEVLPNSSKESFRSKNSKKSIKS